MRLNQRPSFVRTLSRAALVGLLALGMAGCGRPNSETPSAAPTGSPVAKTSDGTFKVALITPGSISDNGWNASAYKGLEAVRSELHLSQADSPYVENANTPGQREEHMRGFARDGASVIFCHGSEFDPQALKMEKDFPKTLFVISSGGKVSSNTMPIVYQLEDGAYLEGMLAAGMSKSGILGSVGAESSPPVKSVFLAFAAGAKSVNPNARVLEPVFTGSWDDVGKAKQATLALIQQGADVIMQDFDSAAQGVFKAVEENKEKGVYTLGANSDQNAVSPDVILASASIDSGKAFVPIAKAAQEGMLKPNDKPFGMKEGVIDFILNPKLESKIPADLKTKLDETKKKITDGSFVVPKGGS